MTREKLEIDPPLMNACGILSYLPVFEKLEKHGVNVGAWVPKSIGPREKQGNENPVIYYNEDVTMNSFALPSMDRDSFEKELEGYEGEAPLIISHYGDSSEQYGESIERFDGYAEAHEINISCPNFEPGEESVLESSQSLSILEQVRESTDKPVIAKLSPSENYVEIAKEAVEYADYINCGNTVGEALDIDPYTGEPSLTGQFGGMSGGAVRPVNMGMVHRTYTEIGGGAEIIAAGGISEPEHIISYARAGASIFQIGTALVGKTSKEKADYFNELWQDTEEILQELDADSIEEIRGDNNVE